MSSSSRCLMLSGAVAILLSGCFGAPQNDYKAPPPPEVTVAHPLSQTVTMFVEENGETEAVERAEVRARVRGYLESIEFEPGQEVKQGDVLFVIEKDEYAAAVEAAKAALASAEATIKVSEAKVEVSDAAFKGALAEFERQKNLLAQEATTQSNFDAAEATKAASEADLQSSKANVVAAQADRDRAAAALTKAELDLEYTSVSAPISGVVTKTSLKRGNLAENGTLLATIIDKREIYTNFNLSDRQVLRFQKARLAEVPLEEFEKMEWRGHPVYMKRELDDGFPFQGEGDYVDEEGIDQATGTLALRAKFQNPNDLLAPGMFVRVRVPLEKMDGAIVVPDASILRNQRGEYVLTVDSEDKVQETYVTTGLKFDGWSVIEKGLSTEDRIITKGIQKAREGVTVSATEETLPPPEQLDMQQGADEENEPDQDSEAKPVESEEAAN